MRGEPLVEIESGRQFRQLAQIGLGHFAFQNGLLQVQLVVGVVAGHADRRRRRRRRRGRAAAKDAAAADADAGNDAGSDAGGADAVAGKAVGHAEGAEDAGGRRRRHGARAAGAVGFILPSRLPVDREKQTKTKRLAISFVLGADTPIGPLQEAGGSGHAHQPQKAPGRQQRRHDSRGVSRGGARPRRAAHWLALTSPGAESQQDHVQTLGAQFDEALHFGGGRARGRRRGRRRRRRR